MANCVSSDKQTDIFKVPDRSTYLSHLAEGNYLCGGFLILNTIKLIQCMIPIEHL